MEVLGQGGQGIVYRAQNPDLDDMDVAIKMPRTRGPRFRDGAGTKGSSRLEREKAAYVRLNHPNIARILDAGTHASRPYIVMEFVQGVRLRDRLRSASRGSEGDRLSTDEVVSICLHIARGLQHAHERQLVHRDLKPENGMIHDDGAVKILDFGLVLL
ncbi:MAG: serine/threonine protein kinase, partial [Candidatus Eisenbacteria bacterium]|nr:serine/threonine protein kinase [Candidatus Eisenbacteria bacterium]